MKIQKFKIGIKTKKISLEKCASGVVNSIGKMDEIRKGLEDARMGRVIRMTSVKKYLKEL